MRPPINLPRPSESFQSSGKSKTSAQKPQQRKWKGLKKAQVKAYIVGIAKKSKNVWTWIDIQKIARQLDVSTKTVWRVIKTLADEEKSESEDSGVCVRMCQRQTENNFHFQWMIADRAKLKFDKEPLFLRRDGKTRHLRLRCRKENLPATKTNHTGIVNQQKRDSTPAADDWKAQVPPIVPLFWLLGIPTYNKKDPLGLTGKSNRIWAHSPWKREQDKNPSCLIYVDEHRFYDFSTGQGGNAITLARIHHHDPTMPFQAAFEWLKSLRSSVSAPAAWWTPGPTEQQANRPLPALPNRADGLFGNGNLESGADEAIVKPTRDEGRFRLAWLIFRQQFAGVSIPCVNRRGVVTLIARALGRQYEKGAIEEAIRAAIASYQQAAPEFAARSKFYSDSYRHAPWRHRDLRNAVEPEHYEDLFGLAHFLKALRRNLDNAYEPPKVSAPVERNADPAAIEMCRNQILSMFYPNEFVWMTNSLRHRGWCRTAEYWLEDIKTHGVPTGPDGAWLKQNPMAKFGTGNDDVRAFRHALCEADSLSLQDQIKLSEVLPYPVVSAVHSGGKSIHYLLKIDATKETYAGLVKDLHERFPAFDKACKDPARWTRLAGARRAGKLQEALLVHPGETPHANPQE